MRAPGMPKAAQTRRLITFSSIAVIPSVFEIKRKKRPKIKLTIALLIKQRNFMRRRKMATPMIKRMISIAIILISRKYSREILKKYSCKSYFHFSIHYMHRKNEWLVYSKDVQNDKNQRSWDTSNSTD